MAFAMKSRNIILNSTTIFFVVGFLCIRHYELMLGPEVKELYHYLLTSRDASIKLKCQVLRNLQNYLTEEELKMMKADAECKCASCHSTSLFDNSFFLGGLIICCCTGPGVFNLCIITFLII